MSRSGQDHLALGLDQPGEHRVEVPTAPLAGELPRSLDSPEAVRDLDVLGHVRDACGEGDVVSLELAGPATAVPALVRSADRLDDVVRERELLCHRAGDRRVVGDHAVDLAVPREREREAEPEPVQRRAPGPELPHSRRRHSQAPRVVVVLDRLEGDVVAEPLGLLVGVGVAAHVDEEGGVVDDRALLLVEPEALGEPQRDQALPQDVLHRLPEAEVDAERERGNELRQTDLRAIAPAGHLLCHLRRTIGQSRADEGTAGLASRRALRTLDTPARRCRRSSGSARATPSASSTIPGTRAS